MPARPTPVYGALPEVDLLLGGRYRLRAPIGSGGTADVFRAVDQVLGREVAVKVFREGSDTVTVDRFCEEARTLARLSHRALVTVYDAGRHGQSAFMVTELIRGVSMRARISAGPLSPFQVTRLGADIASALDHVHAQGVIHHDVKPSNVLLGEDNSPHLADFGLSRPVNDHSHSAPDTLVGTLGYMAPEQFLGQGASTASDIYALGVTLLEAITGHREYQGTPVEIGTAHLLRPPRIPEWLPVDLARLLKAMTDQAPSTRPDAAAVHLRLQAITLAPPARTAASAAPEDTSTHRPPLPPIAGVGSRAAQARTPDPTKDGTTGRRRKALLGLTAVSLAGACVILLGGIPAGEDTQTTAPVREQPPASKDTEAAGPRVTPPAPPPASRASAIPQLPTVAPSTAPELPTHTRPDGSSSRRGEGRPAKEPGAAKSKDVPGKAKGKKDKGR
ncbi:serine/threonine protein kinase [Streptomyces sp. NBC_01426]|uniref:serine/threonine-protein kinase n=1 Tax=Streptomyces sp. NBC_01426 TaxID=2975866 RepID=UPI002E2F40A2|nr:serine/threonine-protein kinase [Streptomyces sp. NBC_01426]